MHYDIIFVTKKEVKNININYLWVDTAKVFNNYIEVNNTKYTYDYLVVDEIHKELNLMTEDGRVITNQFFQTTNEYIYAVGSIVNSNISFEEQIKLVLENIEEPF